MPLTSKGEEILANMKKQYGAAKGEEVFYASANKGTITGVHDAADSDPARLRAFRLDAAMIRLDACTRRMDAYCARDCG